MTDPDKAANGGGSVALSIQLDGGRTEQSEIKRQALELVAQGLTSKEVSQRLKLSPHTVDGYMRAAIRLYGVATRREAARLYLANTPPQPLMTSTATLAEPAPVAAPDVGPATIVRPGWWQMPPLGGAENDLSVIEKTSAILRIAAMGTLVVIALAAVIAGALHTF